MKKTITEKEFLKAVDTINKYQKQISEVVDKASTVRHDKTFFLELVDIGLKL